MAFQYWQHRGGQHVRKTSFICLEEAYHGDTIGSVSVGGMPLFHSTFGPLLFDSHRAEPGDIDDLARLLALREEEVAAVVLEPLVQGAAGMLTHPPGYLRAVRRLCDRHGVLLICDEVATGLRPHRDDVRLRAGGRLARPALRRQGPDRWLHAARRDTRDRADLRGLPRRRTSEYKTFFHGHTYTGNPLACAAAIASLEVFERERTLVRIQPKIRLLSEWLAQVERMREVKEVRQRGLMVGIDLGEHDPGAAARAPRRRSRPGAAA